MDVSAAVTIPQEVGAIIISVDQSSTSEML